MKPSERNLEHGRAELVLGHPGHELQLLGWMQSAKPRVWVLTSGAKSLDDRRRIAASADTVRGWGAFGGSIFGPVLDAQVYADILAGRSSLFEQWADELRDAFVARGSGSVIVDGWQLYSPVHDLAHLLGRVAAAEAGVVLGRRLECFQFPVVASWLAPLCQDWTVVQAWDLDEAMLEEKLRIAAGFPGLEADVADAMTDDGAHLRYERLCRAPAMAALILPPGTKATYETIAQERVARGVYVEPLRWRHFDVIRRRLLRRWEQALTVAEALT